MPKVTVIQWINWLISKTSKWSITWRQQCFQRTFHLKPCDRLDPNSYVPFMSWDSIVLVSWKPSFNFGCCGNIDTYNWGKLKNLVTSQKSDFKLIWQKWSISQTLPRLFKPSCTLKNLAPWSDAIHPYRKIKKVFLIKTNCQFSK